MSSVLPATLPKFVRVTGMRGQQFIEFVYAIGEPELFVEMILPVEHFEAFCRDNQVIQMDSDSSDRIDADKQQWRSGDSQLTQRPREA